MKCAYSSEFSYEALRSEATLARELLSRSKPTLCRFDLLSSRVKC
jgi:hypothetical protein